MDSLGRKEPYRQGSGFFVSLSLEGRRSLRRLARSPCRSLGIVALLAFGFALNTSIVSLVRGVLLRPLPYPESEHLVAISSVPDFLHGVETPVAPLDFFDWRRSSVASSGDGSSGEVLSGGKVFSGDAVFEELAAFMFFNPALTGTGDPTNLVAAAVTPNFFETLRLRPEVGRFFRWEEGRLGHNNVAVLSYGLWQRLYGGSTDILGRPITLDGESYTVLGVTPRHHEYPSPKVEIWLALAFDEETIGRRRPVLKVLGRLVPGQSLASAQSAMTAQADRLAAAYPETNEGRGVAVRSLRDSLVAEFRTGLLALLGAGILVLVVIVLNVSGLVAAQALAAREDLFLRRALGARRSLSVVGPLWEGVILTAAGAVVALPLSLFFSGGLLRIVPDQIRRLEGVGLDGFTLAVWAVAALLVGLAVSLLPLVDGWRSLSRDGAVERSRGDLGGRRRTAVRRGLVVGQAALALLLLSAAGLLLKSLDRVRQEPLGFAPDRILALQMQLPASRYPDPPRRIGFFQRFLADLRAIPGVDAAGAAAGLPLQAGTAGDFDLDVAPEGSEDGAARRVSARIATPEYFSVLGISVRSGRVFREDDRLDRPKVVVVNETLARQLWSGEDPVGRKLEIFFGEPRLWEVVGVVGDTLFDGPDRPPKPEFFWSYGQFPDLALSVVLRTRGDPRDIVGQAQAALWKIDPDQPIFRIVTMGELLERATAERRFHARLAGLAALTALLLAVSSVASLLAQGVELRRREIGIRRALGESRGSVRRSLLREACLLTAVGAALGLVLASISGRWISSLLFRTPALEPQILLAASLVLLLGAVAGSYLPARRAEAIEPSELLRQV